jgi:flagellar hook protein FlgE
MPWDAQNPFNTSNFSTSIALYDGGGNAHPISVCFVKELQRNTWDYHVLVASRDLASQPTTASVEIGTGTLNFSTGGALESIDVSLAMSVTFAGEASPQSIALNFGTSIANGGQGTDGVTQYDECSNVSAQSQDGWSAGFFAGLSVDAQGIVTAVYSNSMATIFGRFASAHEPGAAPTTILCTGAGTAVITGPQAP